MKNPLLKNLGCAVVGLALVGLLAFGAAGRASATGSIIYVKANATGAKTGASWADAYTSLQSALGAAVSGDRIWVAKGTYKPGTARSSTFTLKNGVAVYGGFAGTETALSLRKPGVNITILSGDIGGAGDITDNSYHVVTGSGTNNTAILDGFKILAGMADGTGAADSLNGGGMYNYYGSPTLRNLIFSGNRGYYGGGMYNYSGSPKLVNVSFNGNISLAGGVGGGMANAAGSNATLNNVTFNGNLASFAGGMYNNSSTPTITNVTFSGNIASSGGAGGGLFNEGSNPILRNVTFSGNSAGVGAAMLNGSSSPYIYNSIFWGNGTEEINNAFSTPTISNSIVKGGCPPGSICPTPIINADPRLGPLQNNGGFTQTMALGAASPAIDAGNNSTCAATDQRGVRRPVAGKCDLGAYEVKALIFFSQAANDGWVLESAKGSNVGGSLDSAATILQVGDDSANRQYRGFLSFNTAPLPDIAKIVLAKVGLRNYGTIGTKPFTTHGTLWLDVVKPYFGLGLDLVPPDFQAGATALKGGTVGPTLSGGYYWGLLNSTGRAAVSRTGTTQLRLRFNLKTNNDNRPDYLKLYSGNATSSANKPTLIVYYNP